MPKKKWSKFAGKYLVKGSREWKRQRASELSVLQRMDPEEFLKDIDRWEQYKGIPYRTHTTERAALHKMAGRLGRLEGGRAAGAGGGTPSSWLDDPAYVPWAAPPGGYGRWGAGGLPGQYAPSDVYGLSGTGQNMGWYAPRGEVKDQPWLTTINRLLPYMNPEDQTTMARQLYTAGGGAGGPFGGYLGVGKGQGVPTPPAPATAGGTYSQTLASIGQVLDKIPDETARAWARSVFDIYTDMTQRTGMRGSEEEARFKASLDEMFASIPESAQPYAAALQRLVVPTVLRPAQEYYEKTAEQRTSPTHWGVAAGLRANPMWR